MNEEALLKAEQILSKENAATLLSIVRNPNVSDVEKQAAKNLLIDRGDRSVRGS